MWDRTLDYLYNQRPAFERDGGKGYKPGLDTALTLDKFYNEPHRRFRIIHIAGTNGKGSTAHLLASCLQLCGYRVGLFTSPHLIDFRERIQVNGKKISRNYVMQWVNDLQKKNLGGIQPSFFELTTAMAFDFFAWRNVNIAVVETGLGGRLDSTNIVTPEMCVITNVGLDHQQFLGDTIEDIAREKAGIIKLGQPLVVGRADGTVREIIESEAKRLYSSVRFAQDKPEVISARHVDDMLQLTTENYGTINCQLTGDYQIENANTVLVTLSMLKRLKYRIKENLVQEGFAHVIENTGLLGRWMKIGDLPLTICDSAHNPPAMEQVIKQLRRQPHEKIHIVLGFMADKDVTTMLRMMPAEAKFYFTQANNPRSLTAKKLLKMAKSVGHDGTTYNNVNAALKAALKQANVKDLIYIGGSMYVIAELLEALGYGSKD